MQCNTQQVNFRPVLFPVSALSIRMLAQLGKFLTDGLRIYWDENSGPSTAYENTLGSIPSEAFTLYASGTTPEPSSIMLFGSGILGLAGALRRRLTR